MRAAARDATLAVPSARLLRRNPILQRPRLPECSRVLRPKALRLERREVRVEREARKAFVASARLRSLLALPAEHLLQHRLHVNQRLASLLRSKAVAITGAPPVAPRRVGRRPACRLDLEERLHQTNGLFGQPLPAGASPRVDRGGRLAVVREGPREKCEEHHAATPHVSGEAIIPFACNHLGRDIALRAHAVGERDRAVPAAVDQPVPLVGWQVLMCQPKVDQLDRTALCEQHILELDVAVSNAARVAVAHRVQELAEEGPRGVLGWERERGDSVEELPASCPLHRDVVVRAHGAVAEHRADVRMLQHLEAGALAHGLVEFVLARRMEHLDRHGRVALCDKGGTKGAAAELALPVDLEAHDAWRGGVGGGVGIVGGGAASSPCGAGRGDNRCRVDEHCDAASFKG